RHTRFSRDWSSDVCSSDLSGDAGPTDAKVPPAGLIRVVERVRQHLHRLHQRLVPAPIAIGELIIGAWVSQAIAAAAKLRIADAQVGRASGRESVEVGGVDV